MLRSEHCYLSDAEALSQSRQDKLCCYNLHKWTPYSRKIHIQLLCQFLLFLLLLCEVFFLLWNPEHLFLDKKDNYKIIFLYLTADGFPSLLLVLPFASAISTTLKGDYTQKETIITEIKGNILSAINEKNIEFKRKTNFSWRWW